jgi:hypothetical protein
MRGCRVWVTCLEILEIQALPSWITIGQSAINSAAFGSAWLTVLDEHTIPEIHCSKRRVWVTSLLTGPKTFRLPKFGLRFAAAGFGLRSIKARLTRRCRVWVTFLQLRAIRVLTSCVFPNCRVRCPALDLPPVRDTGVLELQPSRFGSRRLSLYFPCPSPPIWTRRVWVTPARGLGYAPAGFRLRVRRVWATAVLVLGYDPAGFRLLSRRVWVTRNRANPCYCGSYPPPRLMYLLMFLHGGHTRLVNAKPCAYPLLGENRQWYGKCATRKYPLATRH